MPHGSYLIVLASLLFVAGSAPAQDVDEIVKNIKAINEVHCDGIGIAGEKSKQYGNYEELCKKATTFDLVNLTDDSSGVVNCYAAMALTERRYNGIPTLFIKFLSKDKEITAFCGCLKDEGALLSEQVYSSYLFSIEDNKTDRNLLIMDSAILYADHAYWWLTYTALKNRVYPTSYNKRIEHLAFNRLNKYAIFYLLNHDSSKYKIQAKSALLAYLKKAEFSKTGTTDYLEIVTELLKYRSKDVNQAIFTKLKADLHWKHEYGKFLALFSEYSLEKSLPSYN